MKRALGDAGRHARADPNGAPAADMLWIDGNGITRRDLVDVPHWRDVRRFFRDPDEAVRRLLDDGET